MGKSSIWIIWGTKNEGAFILVDILCCHYNSDTVDTAAMNGHRHPSNTVQILSLLTLMRCSWNQQCWVNLSGLCCVSGEKEMLKDRTWLAVSLLPGEWVPALHWCLTQDWIFLMTLCRHRSWGIFMLRSLQGSTLWKRQRNCTFFQTWSEVNGHISLSELCWFCLRYLEKLKSL